MGVNVDHDTVELAPVPVLEERPWMVFAACREADPELFFPDTREQAERALLICRACVVRDQCLEFALATGERFGIWGGTTEHERRKLGRRPA